MAGRFSFHQNIFEDHITTAGFTFQAILAHAPGIQNNVKKTKKTI